MRTFVTAEGGGAAATLDPATFVAFARATDAAEALAALLALAPGAWVSVGVGVQTGIGVGLGPAVAVVSDAPSGPLRGGGVAVGGRGVGEGDAVTLAMLLGVGDEVGVGVTQAAGVSGAAVACPADHPKSATIRHAAIALAASTAHGRRLLLYPRIPFLTVGAICPNTLCSNRARFVKSGPYDR